MGKYPQRLAMTRPKIRPSGWGFLPYFSRPSVTAHQRPKVCAVAGVMAVPWLLLAALSCGHSGDQGRKSMGTQNLAQRRASTPPHADGPEGPAKMAAMPRQSLQVAGGSGRQCAGVPWRLAPLMARWARRLLLVAVVWRGMPASAAMLANPLGLFLIGAASGFLPSSLLSGWWLRLWLSQWVTGERLAGCHGRVTGGRFWPPSGLAKTSFFAGVSK